MLRKITLLLALSAVGVGTWTACVGDEPAPITPAVVEGGASSSGTSGDSGAASSSGTTSSSGNASSSSSSSSTGGLPPAADGGCYDYSFTTSSVQCRNADGGIEMCGNKPVCCPGVGCVGTTGDCPAAAGGGFACYQKGQCGSAFCCIAAPQGIGDAGSSCNSTYTLTGPTGAQCHATPCPNGMLNLCSGPGGISTCPSGLTCRTATVRMGTHDEIVDICTN